jgi:hypothetical protein
VSATAYHAEVGPMITGGDVELAVVDVLKEWMPAYICEGERKRHWAVGSTPWPKGWAITGRDLQKLNSDQLPCIVVMSGGVIQPPRKSGAPGALDAVFDITVGSVFSTAWGRNSRERMQLFTLCARLILQQRTWLASGVDFRGETYDEMDFGSSRTYSAGVASFNVLVRNVSWADGGPPPDAAPPTDPHVPFAPWVEVVDTEIEVDHYPPPESLPQQ